MGLGEGECCGGGTAGVVFRQHLPQGQDVVLYNGINHCIQGQAPKRSFSLPPSQPPVWCLSSFFAGVEGEATGAGRLGVLYTLEKNLLPRSANSSNVQEQVCQLWFALLLNFLSHISLYIQIPQVILSKRDHSRWLIQTARRQ